MLKGIFWFFIAITLILVLLDERVSPRGASPLAAGWVGAFVLYYGLRSSPGDFWPGRSSRRWPAWLRRYGKHAPLALDLAVMSVLLMLTGGWASPLYLLYLGWTVALIGEVSALTRLVLTALAAGLFGLGCVLSLPVPLLPAHITIITEHLLLLLVASCGAGLVEAYIRRLRYAWEAERRQWDSLRDALFAQLSHELYTPLSAVSASASLLSTAGAALQIEQQRHLAQAIERNCTRMGVLIDDLLVMWRKQRQQPEMVPRPLRCLEVAESIALALGPLLEAKGQRLVIHSDQPELEALADERRLEQVLMNLLANAHQYAPAGTAITLTMSAQPDAVLFALHDDGAGVPLEEQGHLFDLLYRGTNSLAASRGSGIGLALARTLVVEEGGHIWIESAPGMGSTFYFTLPASRKEYVMLPAAGGE